MSIEYTISATNQIPLGSYSENYDAIDKEVKQVTIEVEIITTEVGGKSTGKYSPSEFYR